MKTSRAGMTLFELLIVMTIVGVVFDRESVHEFFQERPLGVSVIKRQD